ncbi:MAG: DUF3326 domain-containing protein [Cyanobacteria bacterium LVE1205-1]|jgi:hypothetical protein
MVSLGVNRPYVVVLLIPTGIGASIGGYAGDAIPIARSIAAVVDCLITHPNVLNGAQLYGSASNILYVEGYGLDQFASGMWGLRPVHQNRVGLLLDQGIEPELRIRHLQAADAVRATLGVSMTDYALTDTPLDVGLHLSSSGAAWGTIANPDSLLRGAEKLIRDGGAEAIAVVSRFPDEPNSPSLQAYRHGQGVDHLAGAEAVISHLVVRTFHIPCAHAPALQPLPLDLDLAPRSAAEELGYTFLPSVLVGLNRAPQFITHSPLRPVDRIDGLWANQVDAVVVPDSACGGSAVLNFSHSATRLITVTENQTQMAVFPDQLQLPALRLNSYLEVIGAIAAHRAGVNVETLVSHVSSIKPIP